MKDALGSPQSALVLGGNSDIALATIRQLAQARLQRVVLAGRNVEAMKTAAKTLASESDLKVDVVSFDALDFASHKTFVDGCFDQHGDFDLVLLAFGVLGDQATDETDSVATAGVIGANFTGAASVLIPVAQRMRQQGHGTITVLSTVAGERARAANYIYGSSKAGLDAFCQGLGDSLVGTGVKVMVVRPGFVTTKMTSHLETKPMSTTAEAVANDIVVGLGRGSEIIWSPAKLRAVFTVMRHLPRPVFRRIKA